MERGLKNISLQLILVKLVKILHLCKQNDKKINFFRHANQRIIFKKIFNLITIFLLLSKSFNIEN